MMMRMKTKTKRTKNSPTNRRSSANPMKTSRYGTAIALPQHKRPLLQREDQDAERYSCISHGGDQSRAVLDTSRRAMAENLVRRDVVLGQGWQAKMTCAATELDES